MDYFHAEMTPSPTPEDQLLGTPMTNPSTPNTKKTLQKPISTKVTKKKSGNTTVNPSPNRVFKTSPMPKVSQQWLFLLVTSNKIGRLVFLLTQAKMEILY
jgi:hypothetical protein